jgi:hypothetical protein
LKGEVLWETLAVPFELFVKPLGRDPVKRREMGVEDDTHSAEFADHGVDGWLGTCEFPGGHGGMGGYTGELGIKKAKLKAETGEETAQPVTSDM